MMQRPLAGIRDMVIEMEGLTVAALMDPGLVSGD